MITELVFFDLPPDITREAVLALYRKTAEKWLTNPDLIQKYYFFDPERALGGGVYIWKDREAAERWHGAEYRQMVQTMYGSPPRIQILDALLHVEPASGKLAEY
ncbi:hypothetical protein [Paraburkholderia solisilvae]|uniref:Monooxygenase n=1 Tax=Paraburkholderia solisilvae TaxID=624376 RepID=A0A6J5EGB2_9BURK|nr:hypothetical protein [Paraburkholderia solisilvae]CAB3764232.1 hypothetical protein LMG29739_04284 [Paraburkholderia solisilvae]